MTVGDVLDALANVRRETPFVEALGAGEVAGPVSVELTEGAEIADAPGHYVVAGTTKLTDPVSVVVVSSSAGVA